MTSARVERPVCPFANGEPFDPRSVAAAEDSEPWFGPAREHAPVFYVPEMDVWYVTRYKDVVAVLQDTSSFSSRYSNRFKPMTTPALRSVYPEGHPGLHSMLLKDPPEHSRVRRLANRAFTPRMVALLEPQIRRHCRKLIAAFVSDGECDIQAQFASKLPVAVMTDLAGSADAKGIDLSMWGEDYFALIEGAPTLSDEQEACLVARAERMLAWLDEIIEARRTQPGDDLLSALILARTPEGDPALTSKEVVAVLSSMMSAGIETTAVFIPELLWYLLSHPDLWARVVAEPDVRTRAIDEGLRLLTPARGIRRCTTRPVTIGGIDIPANVDVFVSFRSANYDSETFVEPATFDLDRPNSDRHLSFGRGTHFCIGGPLARLEARCALDTLISALPGLRLAEPGGLMWAPNAMLPRPLGLRVRWDADAVP